MMALSCRRWPRSLERSPGCDTQSISTPGGCNLLHRCILQFYIGPQGGFRRLQAEKTKSAAGSRNNFERQGMLAGSLRPSQHPGKTSSEAAGRAGNGNLLIHDRHPNECSGHGPKRCVQCRLGFKVLRIVGKGGLQLASYLVA